MRSTTLLEAMYGLGRPKPAVIQVTDSEPRLWALTRDVRHYKGRRYVVQRKLHSTGDEAVRAFHSYLKARNEKALAQIEAATLPFLVDKELI